MDAIRMTSAHTALMEQFPIEKDAVEHHSIIENPLVQNDLVILDAGQSIAEHASDQLVVATLVYGSIEFTVQGEVQYMHAGDVIYMAPGELHSIKAMEQSYMSLTKINSKAVDCLEDEEAEEEAEAVENEEAEAGKCGCNCSK
ncbi:cupin domain-containing protein [Bifidobacterium magnum]|uniref:Cupin domain containing protein n=1 Tax=Bifidobacterium magnum TaxID=1692 RepID=A0A087BB70_9BIFI|nr:cupin domain-containing protein [Bifidobacterium magnum]KFI68270.1 Cupin domain containing protein [Bifidobacterium magnum]